MPGASRAFLFFQSNCDNWRFCALAGANIEMTSRTAQSSPSGTSLATPKDNRLMSLDVLRGLAVAGMILVTDPGTYSAVYWPLLHAQWNGATPTDMIFPAFLFAVGVSIPLAFAVRVERGQCRTRLARHVLIRSGIIFCIGLAINGFPDYNLHTIRIPGVLQRIALCYLGGSLLFLGIRGRESRTNDGQIKSERAEWQKSRRIIILAGTATFLLATYWALLKLVPVPGFGPGRLDSLGNLGAYIDRSVFGIRHLWAWGLTPGYGVTFDPEGLLSTIPAVATLVIGMMAGEWLRIEHSRVRKVVALAGAGIVLALLGWLLHPLFPINKKLWTSTFALFSGGVSLLAFSVLYSILDSKRWRWWAPPALVFGTNAILAYAISNVITTLTDRIPWDLPDGSELTLHEWGYRYGFATWLSPIHASLAYAITIVLLNLAILYPLYRKRIFLRV
jgi:predicted acyltransferase